jgi:hypothetical protein
MVIVGKFINGICLNPLEYLLDKPEKEGGKHLEFIDKEEAIEFLKSKADDVALLEEDVIEGIFHFIDTETNKEI